MLNVYAIVKTTLFYLAADSTKTMKFTYALAFFYRSTSLNVAWCCFLHRQASDGLLRNLL